MLCDSERITSLLAYHRNKIVIWVESDVSVRGPSSAINKIVHPPDINTYIQYDLYHGCNALTNQIAPQ